MNKGSISFISMVSVSVIVFGGFVSTYFLSDTKIETVRASVEEIDNRVIVIEETLKTLDETKETMKEFNRNSAQTLEAIKKNK